jgi:hypothetical protein
LPEYSDIYVISDRRNISDIYSFLDRFLPDREESADEYEVHDGINGITLSFTHDNEVIKYCCSHSHVDHRIYWRNSMNSKPEHANVFFLNDSYVIYGLATDAENKGYAKDLFDSLKIFLNSRIGYIGNESSPNSVSYDEFISESNAYDS